MTSLKNILTNFIKVLKILNVWFIINLKYGLNLIPQYQ